MEGSGAGSSYGSRSGSCRPKNIRMWNTNFQMLYLFSCPLQDIHISGVGSEAGLRQPGDLCKIPGSQVPRGICLPQQAPRGSWGGFRTNGISHIVKTSEGKGVQILGEIVNNMFHGQSPRGYRAQNVPYHVPCSGKSCGNRNAITKELATF